MYPHTTIRRHADGSIDVEYYAALGRGLHGAAVRHAVSRIAARLMKAAAARRPGAADGPRRAVRSCLRASRP